MDAGVDCAGKALGAVILNVLRIAVAHQYQWAKWLCHIGAMKGARAA